MITALGVGFGCGAVLVVLVYLSDHITEFFLTHPHHWHW